MITRALRPVVAIREGSHAPRSLAATLAGGAACMWALLAAPAPLAAAAPQVDPDPPTTLRGAMLRAVEVHPSMEAAGAAARAAGAGVAEARSARLPILALQGSAVRFEEPMVVAPIHAFDPAAPPAFDRTLLQGTASLSYTLFDGGRRGADVRRAEALEGAAGADLQDARAALMERTARAYLGLLTAREVVSAQTAREEALDAELDRARQLVETGTAPRLEMLRAEAELAQARAEGERARRAQDLAARTLGWILDVPPEALADAPLTPPSLPPRMTPPDEALPAGGPGGRSMQPALRAAEEEASAAEARRDLARSAWLPRVEATGGYNLYSAIDATTSGEWQGGIRLSYPLFTGGSRGAAVDAATARAAAARARVEVVREEVALAADRAWSAEVEARARLEAWGQAVGRYAELVRVERLALDEGAGIQSDWLRAQAGLFQSRAGLARARQDVIEARIALVRTRGVLTPERLDTWLEGGS